MVCGSLQRVQGLLGGAHGRVHVLFGSGPWACCYCHAALVCPCSPELLAATPHLLATIEHKLPLSRGGGSDPANLVVACRRCNISKGARLFPDEWVPQPNEHTLVQTGAALALKLTAGVPVSLKMRGLVQLLDSVPAKWATVGELAELTGEKPDEIRLTLKALDREAVLCFEPRLGHVSWHLYFPMWPVANEPPLPRLGLEAVPA